MPSTTQAHSAAPQARAEASELAHGILSAPLPATVYEAGERVAFHSLEFFAADLSNPNTRLAYGCAVAELCRWCGARGLSLPDRAYVALKRLAL